MAFVKVACNAKINLCLRVLGQRTDGYHEIETVFHSISLHDVLTVTRRKRRLSVSSNSADIPHDESNLALRAVKALVGEREVGAHVSIDKRIPVSAGLGGGSADAAGALFAANRVLDLGYTREQLENLARGIGSDVRFTLRGGCCVGRGRGDELEDLPPLPRWPLVIVVPPVSVSTKWAYETLSSGLTTTKRPSTMITGVIGEGDVHSLGSVLLNDFEALVFGKYPIVKEIKQGLLDRGAAGALMSGSGPAVFGIFEKEVDARESSRGFMDEGLTVFLASLEGFGVTILS